MLRNERLLLTFLKRRRPILLYRKFKNIFLIFDNKINIKHIYSLLPNLCGEDVYLMRIKGRSKAARN